MKQFQFLLLDAGPIIKLFSLGIWYDFIKACDVTITRTVSEYEALYTFDGKTCIDLESDDQSGLVNIIDVPISSINEFKTGLGPSFRYDVHDGERETLAFLFNSSEPWVVCAADGAVFRVLGFLGRGEQGISLEEVLKEIGLSRELEWKFTQAFREKYTKFGQIDSIQN